MLPDYEGSDHYRLYPVPGIVGQLGGVGFQIIGPDASVDLLSGDIGGNWHVTAGPVASYGTNRSHLSFISEPRVRALGRVKPAIELGGSVGIVGNGVLTSSYDRLSLSASWRRDVAGAYDGATLNIMASYLMPVSTKTAFLILGGADHAGSRYASTYFGVTPAQSAASGFPVFAAKGGWKDWSLGLMVDRALTGNLTHGLSVVGGVNYTNLVNDFAASPVTSIAGSRGQWMGGLGLAYTF